MLLVPFGPCGGNEERIPPRVGNGEAVRLIHSCDVTHVVFAETGDVYLTVEGGRIVVVTRPDPNALSEAAMGERGCEIAVGIE
jgi:hypothetical protein